MRNSKIGIQFHRIILVTLLKIQTIEDGSGVEFGNSEKKVDLSE